MLNGGWGWGVTLHTEEQKEGNSRLLINNVSKKTMEHLKVLKERNNYQS